MENMKETEVFSEFSESAPQKSEASAAHEKKNDMQELIEKGKKKGKLSDSDIMEALQEVDYDAEQVERFTKLLKFWEFR